MDSDDSNISDHVGDLDIQPYQFEPLCNNESQQESERISCTWRSQYWYTSIVYNTGI
jgi:hypothetical protein